MPSKSKKQHNFMEGIAHGMKPRSGKGPSQAVAEEFVQADKGTKFDGGLNPTTFQAVNSGSDVPSQPTPGKGDLGAQTGMQTGQSPAPYFNGCAPGATFDGCRCGQQKPRRK